MYSRNESIPPTLRLLGNDERAWEGHYEGRHWIARIVHLDETVGVCGLHVATGSARDELTAKVNCRWDYQNDHFLDRFSSREVPAELTCVMIGALRAWLEKFRAQRRQPQFQYAEMGLVMS